MGGYEAVHEAGAAARIRRLNVPDVYDVGIDGSQPYLVELLAGEDPRRLLERRIERSVSVQIHARPSRAGRGRGGGGPRSRDRAPRSEAGEHFFPAERNRIVPHVLDFGIYKRTDREQASGGRGQGLCSARPTTCRRSRPRAVNRARLASTGPEAMARLAELGVQQAPGV
jgi:hypothetical protein